MQLTLLAAVDTASEKLAARVAASNAERFPLFGPNAAQFRERLAVLREDLRSKGAEFNAVRMGLLACAWAPQAAGFEQRLRQIEADLKEVFPGLASYSLTILLPPETAAAPELLATGSLLTSLEAALWETATPDAVYLHQAPMSLYRDPEADDAAVQAVLDVLSMQLCESDTHRVAIAASRQVIDARVCLESGKCCYASAGRVRLFWPKPAVLAHLQARLERDLFVQGLLGEAAKEDELETNRDRAASFFASLARAWAGRFPATVAVSTAALARPTPGQQAGGALTGFERTVEQTLNRHRQIFDDCPTGVEGPVRDEVRRLLAAGENGIRSALLFLDALAATSGGAFDDFEASVFRAPMEAAAGQFFAGRLPEVLSECGAGPAPLRRDDESSLSWVERAMAASAEVLEESDSPAGRPFLRAFRAVVALLEAPRRGSEAAREQLRAALSAFLAGSGECADRLVEKERALSKAAADLRQAPSRYGLAGRLIRQRAEYAAEVQALQQAIADLNRERGEIQAGFQRLLGSLGEMLQAVLLPAWLRARVCGQWWNHLQAVQTEFRAFVATLDRTTRNGFEATAGPSGLREIAREDVATAVREQKLYDRIAGPEPFLRHAAALMAVAPRPPYHKCLNLRDHYDEGVETLLRRIGDYAASRVDAVRQYSVLDVLETLGEEDAVATLASWTRRAREFLDLEPASRQRLVAAGGLNTLTMVWSAPPVVTRLAERFQEAFPPGRVEFVEVDQPDEIRIGAFLFGLPGEAVRRVGQARAEQPPAGSSE